MELSGQNLALNPSLEILEGHFPVDWTRIAGEPRLLHYDQVGKEESTSGPSRRIGRRYLGLAFGDDWTEAVQATLAAPLRAGQAYEVALFVFTGSDCAEGLEEVSVRFSVQGAEPDASARAIRQDYLSLRATAGDMILAKEDWVQARATYIARGGERYLLIGNFQGANQRALAANSEINVETLSPAPCGYFYLDFLKVEEKPTFIESYLLKDVFFETGASTLLPASFAALDRLAETLLRHPQRRARIEGHTDNTGNVESNRRLSSERAAAVAEYLIGRGVAAHRLEAVGYGADRPIADNAGEEGRALNRRVEVRLE
jgi:OOP family OmpA-OmpF porin